MGWSDCARLTRAAVLNTLIRWILKDATSMFQPTKRTPADAILLRQPPEVSAIRRHFALPDQNLTSRVVFLIRVPTAAMPRQVYHLPVRYRYLMRRSAAPGYAHP